MNVKIQTSVAAAMTLLAALYLVIGGATGDMCVDMSAAFGALGGGSSSSSGPGGGSSSSSGPGGGSSSCLFTNDGMCDEPFLCPSGTDTADCSSGRRLEAEKAISSFYKFAKELVTKQVATPHEKVGSLAKLIPAAKREGRRQLQSSTICADLSGADLWMHQITFGSGDADGSATAMIAFFLTLIGFFLCLAGAIFACKGDYKKVTMFIGIALICNVLYWIHLIPYEPGNGLEIKLGWSWGCGVTCGAMINMAVALAMAKSAGKAAVSPGA